MPNHAWNSATLIVLGIAAATTIGSGFAAEKPSRLESIPGSELKRVVLTPKAAQRLDIRTAAVSEQPGQRWLVVEGTVEPMTEGGETMTAQRQSNTGLRVQVVPADDPSRIVADPRSLKANARLVASLKDAAEADADDDDADASKSKSKARTPADASEIVVIPIGLAQTTRMAVKPIPLAVAGNNPVARSGAVQAYEVTTTDHGLRPGQRVYIRLPHPDRDKLHKAIPYSAIIYDRNGDSWVFTNPEPLVFVRSRIDVDSIDGRRAYLKDGPPLGTKVVTAGSAVLLGIEQKFGQ